MRLEHIYLCRDAHNQQMHTDMCSYLWKTENTMRVENGTVNQTDSHGILGFAKFKLKKGY